MITRFIIHVGGEPELWRVATLHEYRTWELTYRPIYGCTLCGKSHWMAGKRRRPNSKYKPRMIFVGAGSECDCQAAFRVPLINPANPHYQFQRPLAPPTPPPSNLEK